MVVLCKCLNSCKQELCVILTNNNKFTILQIDEGMCSSAKFFMRTSSRSTCEFILVLMCIYLYFLNDAAQTAALLLCLVIGTAFALNMLFKLPIWVGVLLTGLSTLMLLALQQYGVFIFSTLQVWI